MESQDYHIAANFTPRAQLVLKFANEEADRLHHNFIGTEHLLLGLIKDESGVTYNVLKKLGLNVENLRKEIERLAFSATDEKLADRFPYTPRSKKALELARREAKSLNHAFIGTEHILLGLLRENDGLAAQVLKNFKVDMEPLRAAILKELGTNSIPSVFTPRVQQALACAREEAERLHHDFVETEHVLLGLLKLAHGVTVNALGKLGLRFENVRAEVEKLTGMGAGKKKAIDIPYASGTTHLVDMAKEEAKRLCHTYIGTEHLLLGLLRENDGLAGKIFRNFKVDVEQLRLAILKELDPYFDVARNSSKFTRETPGKQTTQSLLSDSPTQLTPRAQQVLVLARQESERLRLNYLGTEHLLWGLIELGGNGVATNVLVNRGMNLENVRKEIEKHAIRLGDKKEDAIPYTPRIKRVLSAAREEAEALNHTYVGTEHLLLGLLREEAGPAAEIFKSFNVDREEMRTAVLKELDPNWGKS